MVSIAIAYEGQLRTRAVHGPSSCELVTDAPVDNHGKGESFSPTDLVATGLGSCILTILGIVAERDGLPIAGSSVQVSKHMSSDLPRRIVRLDVDLHLPAALTEADRQKLEKAGQTCPVRKSIHPDIVVNETYHFDL